MKRIDWEGRPSTRTPISADNLNLMQDNIEEYIKGVVLYENENGIGEGEFTLNDDINNYKRLVFFDELKNKVGECLTDAQQVVLMARDQGQVNFTTTIARLNIEESTFRFYSNLRNYFDGSVWRRNNFKLYVTKVIGYKY